MNMNISNISMNLAKFAFALLVSCMSPSAAGASVAAVPAWQAGVSAHAMAAPDAGDGDLQSRLSFYKRTLPDYDNPYRAKVMLGSNILVLEMSGYVLGIDSRYIIEVMSNVVGEGLHVLVEGVDTLSDGTTLRYTPLTTVTNVYTNGQPCPTRSHRRSSKVCLEIINKDVRGMEFDTYRLTLVDKDGKMAMLASGMTLSTTMRPIRIGSGLENVTVRETVCGHSKLKIDFTASGIESLMGTFARGQSELRFSGVIIDNEKFTRLYDDYIAANFDPATDNAGLVRRAKNEALKGALVCQLPVLGVKSEYTANPAYGTDADHFYVGDNPQSTSSVKYLFREDYVANGSPRQRLTGDVYVSGIENGKDYRLVFVPYAPGKEPWGMGDGGSADPMQWYSDAVAVMCYPTSRFKAEPKSRMRINGEVADTSKAYAAGSSLYFSAVLPLARQSADGSVNHIYKHLVSGVNYDWFCGTEAQYTAPDPRFGNVSLRSALASFRAHYPDAEMISVSKTPYEGMDGYKSRPGEEFTANDYGIIKHYVYERRYRDGMSRLMLCKFGVSLNLRLDTLFLVAQPIKVTSVNGVDIEGSGFSACWDYVPLALFGKLQTAAISIGTDEHLPGYDGLPVNEKDRPDYNGALRIGLKHFMNVTEDGNVLAIRIVNSIAFKQFGKTDVAIGRDEESRKVCLVGTDDPQFDSYFANEAFSSRDLVMGRVRTLVMTSIADMQAMTIDFKASKDLLPIVLREGRTYVLSVPYSVVQSGNSWSDGSFILTLKVVPENLVWMGGPDDDWNNDKMWRRADAADIHADSGTYLTNAENGTDKGFVPIGISNVVIKSGCCVRMSGKPHAPGFRYIDLLLPTEIAPYTPGIYWDFSAIANSEFGDTEQYGRALTRYYGKPDGADNVTVLTARYNSGICRRIHVEPGAQIMDSQWLLTGIVSTDLILPVGRWASVALPFYSNFVRFAPDDLYTVPSGDLSGMRYFQYETYDPQKYSYLDPALYNRYPISSVFKLGLGESQFDYVEYFDVIWAELKDNRNQGYRWGLGYSFKVSKLKNGRKNVAIRIPKDEGHWTSGIENGFTLGSSGIFGRRSMDVYYGMTDYATRSALRVGDDMVFVGNPFMCGLDLEEFFAVNDQFEKKFWTDGEFGTVAGGALPDGTGWVVPSGLSVIPPLKAFFVKLKQSEIGTRRRDSVTFTRAMQTFRTDAAATVSVLTVSARTDDGHTEVALVPSSGNMAAGDVSGDVEFVSSVGGQNADVPSVYAISGDKSVAIKRVTSSESIPIGVFAPEGRRVSLTFGGVDAIAGASLYDAATGSTVMLTEGYTVETEGPSHGRFFILPGGQRPAGVGQAPAGSAGLSVYSVTPGEVIVASQEPLGVVSVYTLGGALVRSVDAGGARVCRIPGLDSGVAVVSIGLPAGRVSRKVTVD